MTAIATPGCQASPADRHEHRINFRACRLRLARHFETHRALPRDHDGILKGRNEVGFQLFAEVASYGTAILCIAIIEHDLSAAVAGARDFHFGRIRRHHDHGVDTAKPSGLGDALGMIARRAGHDAPRERRAVNSRNAIIGSAELETSRSLQQFGLAKNPCLQLFV